MKTATKLKLSWIIEFMRGFTVLVRFCLTLGMAWFGFFNIAANEWSEAALYFLIAICVCPIWDRDII